MRKYLIKYYIVFFLISLNILGQQSRTITEEERQIRYFTNFFNFKSPSTLNNSLKQISRNWHESDEILAIETIYLLKSPEYSYRLSKILEEKTGKKYGYDFNKWYTYIWNKPATYSTSYFKFKADIHSQIDSKFYRYFANKEKQSKIRLDEVRWGGVIQDGIPPLRKPEMIDANLATYLQDDNIVFGIEINGKAYAYPKRILAWHEMFTDTIDDIPVAGVYCTLCGTVILYKTQHKGVQYQMGTSGFLYRSNKMMYDKATQSLWSTHTGKPVIGPLVDQGIELEYLSVVTTDWKTWKKQHPNTKVLSLKTGHRRNYNEGIAYRKYFTTDELMFNVPKIDRSLKNKDEVLVLKSPFETDEVIGISSKFLAKRPIFKNTFNNRTYTVFTDTSGAHRVFYTENIEFNYYNGTSSEVFDTNGNRWIINENELTEFKTKRSLKRFHSFNAFWFGLKAAFPKIRLVTN